MLDQTKLICFWWSFLLESLFIKAEFSVCVYLGCCQVDTYSYSFACYESAKFVSEHSTYVAICDRLAKTLHVSEQIFDNFLIL